MTTNTRESHENLVLLRRGACETNHLFLVHAGNGEVEVYLEFCRHLGLEFNCWGLRADRLQGYTPLRVTIEEVAEKYVKKNTWLMNCLSGVW